MTTFSPLLFYNYRTFFEKTIDNITVLIYNEVKLEAEQANQ